MDSLIAAAGRALAAGDALGALNFIALRDDAPALALRGVAMARLGDLARAKGLLKRAARAFGPREAVARARCAIAEAEIALVSRDLASSVKALDAAHDALERRGDRTRHRVGACSRHAGHHRDVGKIDLRQRRHRQLGEGEQAGECDADGQQNGRDRPTDEQLGEAVVHGASVGSGPTDEPAPRRRAMPSKNR